jgi:uncharacterized protein YecE (DUF72 family)
VIRRYGTSSWTAPGWKTVFYPPGVKSTDMLAHYATQFGAVEADTTYYGVPKHDTVRGWRARTPEGFRIAAKFPRGIVHGGEGAKPDPARVLVREHVGAELEKFFAAMHELGDRAGPLVLQFPYFRASDFRGVDAFVDRLEPFLDALPRDFRYAVEVRNPAWVGPRLLGALRERKVAFVLVELARSTPAPWELARAHDLVTADFVYARLIGDRHATEMLTTTFDRIVVDTSERLSRWAELLATFDQKVRESFLFANNHYAGYAPATIRELERLLEERLA